MVSPGWCSLLLLWITLTQTQALLIFRIHNTTKTFEEASKECRESGGTLPVVDTEYVDQILGRILLQKDMSGVWLDGIQTNQPWSWVKGNVALRDQGCFEAMDVWSQKDYVMPPVSNFQACVDFCNLHAYAYAGIMWQLDSYKCMCSKVPTKRQAPMARCPAECSGSICGGDDYYIRLFVTDGEDHVVPWLNSSLNFGGCGALTYNSGGTSQSLTLGMERSRCQVPKPYLCVVPSGAVDADQCHSIHSGNCVLASDQELDWLSAGQDCRERGGQLAALSTSASDLQHWSLSRPGSGSYWIGLTSELWAWQTSQPKVFNFTNWVNAVEDSRSQRCVIMNIDGKWERSDCDRKRSVICQIHENDGGTSVPLPSKVFTSPTTPKTSRLIIPTHVVSSSLTTPPIPPRATTGMPSSVSKSKEEIPIGIIAGVCGGVLLILLVGVASLIVIYRRRKHKRLQEEPLDNSSTNPVYDTVGKIEQNTTRGGKSTPNSHQNDRAVEYIQNVDVNVSSQSSTYHKA